MQTSSLPLYISNSKLNDLNYFTATSNKSKKKKKDSRLPNSAKEYLESGREMLEIKYCKL